MGHQFTSLSERHRTFIEKQKLFFVASAAPHGRVNVSPKGMATFRVLGPNEVAYLDCTGSGSETRAHLLLASGRRLTVMFCAFEGPPLILRLYGQGESLMRGTIEYSGLIEQFEEIPGARQIIRLQVSCVQTSCGMGVPFYEYKEDRPQLLRYWREQGENIKQYWYRKNMASIDGLPTLFDPELMSDQAGHQSD